MRVLQCGLSSDAIARTPVMIAPSGVKTCSLCALFSLGKPQVFLISLGLAYSNMEWMSLCTDQHGDEDTAHGLMARAYTVLVCVNVRLSFGKQCSAGAWHTTAKASVLVRQAFAQ